MADRINVVIDISHYNGSRVDFGQIAQAGIIGVIHKATQGTRGIDPEYQVNKAKARDAGLLWGAYHFGTAAEGVEQAEHFLDVVGTAGDTLRVLDFEPNPTGPTMSLEEARAFVTHVAQVTGRYPGLYSGSLIKEQLGTRSDPVLAQCWFWLAQFGATAVVPANWSTWTMWQYTDGALGPQPHTVDGVGRCDRDLFHGGVDQLRQLWNV